jgi:hypothetical protein
MRAVNPATTTPPAAATDLLQRISQAIFPAKESISYTFELNLSPFDSISLHDSSLLLLF